MNCAFCGVRCRAMDLDTDENLKRLEYLCRHLRDTIPNSYGRVKADLERILKTVEDEIQQLRSNKSAE